MQQEEETFDKWRERQFEDLGADGRNFTRGPQYTPAAGGVVEVHKCSLNFKLGWSTLRKWDQIPTRLSWR